MKRYFTGVFAVVIALAAVAFTKIPTKHTTHHGKLTDFYYQFTGSHGQEATTSLWVQLSSLSDYNSFSCKPGNDAGCKIINTTNSGGHPTSVPLSGGLPDPNTSPNEDAINRGN